MMIITLQTAGTLKPELSVHGDIIKIDLGALLIEVDKEGFKDIMRSLLIQGQARDIFVYGYK